MCSHCILDFLLLVLANISIRVKFGAIIISLRRRKKKEMAKHLIELIVVAPKGLRNGLTHSLPEAQRWVSN